HLRTRAKAPTEEPKRVELLEPLRIADIRLPTRYMLDIPRVHEHDLKSASFQDVEYGNPIDAGGFHRDGGNAHGFQRRRQPMQITGEAPECPHRFRVAVGRDRDDMECRADIDARGMRVNGGEIVDTWWLPRRCHQVLLPWNTRRREGGNEHFPKRD